MKKLIILSATLAALSSNAFAATTNGTTTATIVTAMTISAVNPLQFGSIATIDSGAGNVTLSPAAATVATKNNVTLIGNDSSRSAGSFTVTGEPGTTYVLSPLPSNIILSTGSDTMTVTNLTSSSNRVLSSGTDTLFIGGTLIVAANQTPGAYIGTYQVTVNY